MGLLGVTLLTALSLVSVMLLIVFLVISLGTPSAPTSSSTSPVASDEVDVDSFMTANGEVRVGMTWDEALPLLGSYDSREVVNPDGFFALYTIRGRVYAVGFLRPSTPDVGPYTITRIYRRAE